MKHVFMIDKFVYGELKRKTSELYYILSIFCNKFIRFYHRMRNSKILLVGLRGLQTEVCKNIVLAGIGCAYLLDSETVQISDLSAQFFLKPEDVGKNVIYSLRPAQYI